MAKANEKKGGNGDDVAGVAARVLVDCHLGKVNDIVELDAEALRAAEAGGVVDSSEAAVTYAASLAQG